MGLVENRVLQQESYNLIDGKGNNWWIRGFYFSFPRKNGHAKSLLLDWFRSFLDVLHFGSFRWTLNTELTLSNWYAMLRSLVGLTIWDLLVIISIVVFHKWLVLLYLKGMTCWECDTVHDSVFSLKIYICCFVELEFLGLLTDIAFLCKSSLLPGVPLVV